MNRDDEDGAPQVMATRVDESINLCKRKNVRALAASDRQALSEILSFLGGVLFGASRRDHEDSAQAPIKVRERHVRRIRIKQKERGMNTQRMGQRREVTH